MGLTVVLALPSNGMKLDTGPWCPTEGWPNDCSPLPEQYACGLSSLKDRDLQGRWNTYKQEVKPLSLCTVPFFLVGGSDGDCTRTAEIWNPSFFFFFFVQIKHQTTLWCWLSFPFVLWPESLFHLPACCLLTKSSSAIYFYSCQSNRP